MSLKDFWKDGIDFERIGEHYKILFFLFTLLILIPIFKDDIVLIFNDYEQNKVWKKQDYEKEYFGKVIKKGKDKRNHGFLYFQFRDSTKIFEDYDKVWKKISVGDSVVKKANSKFLFIYKPKKTITINYDDIFKYRDSLMRIGHY